MTFTESITTCFRNYANFKGRASRSEFWWFALFLLIGGFLSMILAFLITGLVVFLVKPQTPMLMLLFFPLAAIFPLVTILPCFAVGARRIRDTGKSDVFIIYLYVIDFVMLVLMVLSNFYLFYEFMQMVNDEGGMERLNLDLDQFKPSFLTQILQLILIAVKVYWLYLLVSPSAPEEDEYNETDSPVKIRRK